MSEQIQRNDEHVTTVRHEIVTVLRNGAKWGMVPSKYDGYFTPDKMLITVSASGHDVHPTFLQFLWESEGGRYSKVLNITESIWYEVSEHFPWAVPGLEAAVQVIRDARPEPESDKRTTPVMKMGKDWIPATPLGPQGRVARMEFWLRQRGWWRLSRLLARWDERGL